MPLPALLAQADVLVSPRITGDNTPMKIYTYLHSGKPILATRIPTHTQVLHPGVAMLAAPQVEEFAGAMARLARNEELRARLGEALAGKCQAVLDERTRYLSWIFDLQYLNHNRGGGILGSHCPLSLGWYPWSGWQERSRKLYQAAAEVARALR